MGDALAVASDWTTPPAAEEPAQASPWTTAGTEQEEYMHEFVEKFVEKTPVVMEEVAAPVVQGEVEQKVQQPRVANSAQQRRPQPPPIRRARIRRPRDRGPASSRPFRVACRPTCQLHEMWLA
ncbi:hypothetical protein PF010_g7235 [Phytophthora fragariae]|uniref:Uncharacterized protein n=1 Tax=Phytophthora fragariae TaxID=53985 RepID=A0A6G0LHZ7_9STRA|nr:hypothetical protein PF010_g7235 [Phytophthora fragariae]